MYCSCSITKSCLTLCDPMDCSVPGSYPPLHSGVCSDSCQLSQCCLLLAVWTSLHPSLFAFNFPQHQGLFPWVSSSYQMAKVLEVQQQSFQWIFRVDFLLVCAYTLLLMFKILAVFVLPFETKKVFPFWSQHLDTSQRHNWFLGKLEFL